jgi:quinol monooxygenase YgiN
MVFYQDTNTPDIMMLFEEWKDWDSLENHIRSDTYRSILELMELSSEQPEIKLSTVSRTKGMEVIEKLRG